MPILVKMPKWGLMMKAGTVTEWLRAEGDAVDLYHFTSVIMRSVNEEGRLRIVEMMWELVYADGQVSEFEDNVVWRASDTSGTPARPSSRRSSTGPATATWRSHSAVLVPSEWQSANAESIWRS